MKKIILAKPRGFCAGVKRALEIVEYSLAFYEHPIYVRHEIVHNKFVVETLREKGVVFVDDIAEVPDHKTVIFSAHGVAPEVWEQAKSKNLKIIDATCPLVTKVHKEAVSCAEKNFSILLIGHKRHVETIGTYGEAPHKITIIENEHDAAQVSVSDPAKVCYLTQTTLSVEDTRKIVQILKQKFPLIKAPSQSDICYATTNRQMAVQKMAEKSDVILVLGSQNSSNSNRLKEIAEIHNTPAYLIDNVNYLQADWLLEKNTIGITAGASAPENLVQEVSHQLQTMGYAEIEELPSEQETMHFRLPKELADLVRERSDKENFQVFHFDQ